LWPQKSNTEWKQPRQWKRINEIRIATWNLSTLHRAGAMNELVKELDKRRTGICALQEEIRWPGKGTVIKQNYVVLYTGHKSDKHEFGKPFYISRHIWIIYKILSL
jgi:hypothetical protein